MWIVGRIEMTPMEADVATASDVVQHKAQCWLQTRYYNAQQVLHSQICYRLNES